MAGPDVASKIRERSRELATVLSRLLAPVLRSNTFGKETHRFGWPSELPTMDSFQHIFFEASQSKAKKLSDDNLYKLEFCPS